MCEWCGGKYDKGYEVPKTAKTKRSSPSSFCSYECWLAFDYKNSLGWSIVLISIGVLGFIGFFAFPSLFQSKIIELIFLIIVGLGFGLLSLWCSRKGKTARRETPKDSRRDQRVDDPLKEYRDY